MSPQVDEAIRALSRWVLILVIGLAGLTVVRAHVLPRFGPEDLAAGKPWRASSKLADCHPENITCGSGRTGVFFHTQNEANPWLELDLGAPTTFSSLLIRNRRDGPKDVVDRAVPLILEVGDDQQTWRTVATLDRPFQEWTPRFEPITARYVRLRVPRTTWFHLDAVKVFR